jgi:hypothetical protein
MGSPAASSLRGSVIAETLRCPRPGVRVSATLGSLGTGRQPWAKRVADTMRRTSHRYQRLDDPAAKG